MPYSHGRALILKQNQRNVLTMMTEEQYQQLGDAMVNYSGSNIYGWPELRRQKLESTKY
jgi:hypothetical protein